MNFVLLLTAANAIASRQYEKVPVADYNKIPSNGSGRIRELIVKNVQYEGLLRDVAFDRAEVDSEDFRAYYPRGYVTDLGDLSTSEAFFTLDAKGMEVLPGKIYEKTLPDMDALHALDLNQLLRAGYTDFVVQRGFDPFAMKGPIRVHPTQPPGNETIRMGGSPSLLFRRNGVIAFVVINGQLVQLGP